MLSRVVLKQSLQYDGQRPVVDYGATVKKRLKWEDSGDVMERHHLNFGEHSTDKVESFGRFPLLDGHIDPCPRKTQIGTEK